MLEFFYTDKFDEDVVLKNNSKTISKKELKHYVYKNISILQKKKENVVIVQKDILSFVINFFASIFTGKNIYLVDDVRKISDLDVDFDILCDCELEYSTEITRLEDVDSSKVLINLMTSGSSGKSKCVIKSLLNLITEAKDIYSTFDFSNEQLIISSSTSCAHLFGLTFGFMFPLCNGFAINLDVVEYPDKFELENSFFVSTPSFLDTVKKNGILLKNAKYIVSAGAKLKDDTFEYLEQTSNVIEIYGSTETGVIAYRRHFEDKALTLFENVKISLLEDTIALKTPYAYQDEVIINDRAEFVGDKIVLKERTDRLLKIQEKRISAESLEKELSQNEFVKEAYCFKYQEKVACLCALSDLGKDFLLKYGLNELSKRLKIYLKDTHEIVPQKWKFIDEIFRTKSGKIDRRIIERMFNMNVSFPIILDRKLEENSVVLKLYLYKSCNFFSGHFPEFPITPGVVQLYLASFYGEYFFNKNLVGGQIRKIKFSNIINAGDVVDLKLTFNERNVSFEYFDNEKTFSSGMFSCENVFAGVV